MESNLYHYKFYITRVIDGDTFAGDLDLGFGIVMLHKRLRLFGINTPEIRGSNKEEGLAVKAFVEDLLSEHEFIIIRSAEKSFDSFGRLLCEVFYKDPACNTWESLNALLLQTDRADIYE